MEKINQKKIIKFEKDKITKNILIVGSGRWAKEIVKVINSNFTNIKKIFILTNYKKQFSNWTTKSINEKIFYLSSLEELRKINCNNAIIANQNKDHLRYCRYLINNNFNVLVEKPLFLREKEYNHLILLSKKKNKKILLSLPYLFASSFNFISKKIDKKRLYKLNFYWFDKNQEIKNKLLKKHDLNINFTSDIFFHIYSILVNMNFHTKFSYFSKIKIIKNYEKFKFGNKNLEMNIISSRNAKVRKRILEIILKNGKKYIINFSKDLNFKAKINNKPIKVPKKFLDTTLKYQIFFFLRNEQTGINNNKLNKLKRLFQYLEILNKK